MVFVSYPSTFAFIVAYSFKQVKENETGNWHVLVGRVTIKVPGGVSHRELRR
jgi:hypothetical protein